MKQWYFDVDDFRPEPGFVFKFKGQGHKGEQYIHRCEVTEIIPRQKLQYSWEYEGHPGFSLVTFELMKQGPEETLVKVTHQGIETFPKDNADFAKQSFNGGWTELITVLLPKHVQAAG